VVRLNLKSLYQFEDDVLPFGYNELEMRERAFSGVHKAIGTLHISPNAEAALENATDAAVATLGKAPLAKSANGRASLENVREMMANIPLAFEQTELPTLRTAVLTSLARHPQVPFFFGTLGQAAHIKLDYETAVVGILADAVLAQATRPTAERLAAAKSLATYADRLSAPAVIDSVTTQLESELKKARTNNEREAAISLLDALKAEPSDNGDDG
jgi:hypothetical protein